MKCDAIVSNIPPWPARHVVGNLEHLICHARELQCGMEGYNRIRAQLGREGKAIERRAAQTARIDPCGDRAYTPLALQPVNYVAEGPVAGSIAVALTEVVETEQRGGFSISNQRERSRNILICNHNYTLILLCIDRG